MILFDDVVQVGTISNLDGTVPTVIEFVIHALRRKAAWVGSKPSRVITLGLAVALESFTEESLGGGNVSRSTEVATRQESPTGRS